MESFQKVLRLLREKIVFVILTIAAVGVAVAIMLLNFFSKNDFVVSPMGVETVVREKPFDKYTVLNLANYEVSGSEVKIEKVLKQGENHTTYSVSFSSMGKKVSGMLKVPQGVGPFPVIFMIRGYVDPQIYFTGLGTERAGEVLADNGFITFAPDFLGYGGSEREAENVFESRFQTYTTVLDGLAAISSIEKADAGKVGIWAHSNGGQVALTLLEATQKEYPTTLWAPVTKPFPYSILYYTDEADDRGKFLRRELAKFEEGYNSDLYSITDYVSRIKAPVLLHQGTADEAVPVKWSRDFNKLLKDENVDITYYEYGGSDHNLLPAWNTVVARDLEFFSSYLK